VVLYEVFKDLRFCAELLRPFTALLDFWKN